MSWDPGERIWYIKTTEDDKKRIKKVLKPILERNKKHMYILTEKNEYYSNYIENDEDRNGIVLYEEGAYKYGGFSSRCTYNEPKLMAEIIKTNNTTIRIKEWESEYTYYLENNKVVCKSKNEMILDQLKESSKEELIEKVKKEEFSFFEKLDKSLREDYDIQFASLQAPYSSWTFEFGTEEEDSYYTDEFLDHEEVVREIFKQGGRYNLFKNRVKDKYKSKKIIEELLPYRPRYISCLNESIKKDKELILKLIDICKNAPKRYIEFNNDNITVTIDATERENIYRNWDPEDEIRLTDISESLIKDKDIVENFIKLNPNNMDDLPDELKEDYNICKLYIENGGKNLTSINNKEILDDKKLMLKIISYCFTDQFENISERLKNDKEIMIEILSKSKSINKEELLSKNIKEMVLYVIDKDPYFYLFANKILPKSILFDKDYILKILEYNKKEKYPRYSIKINKELLEDKEFIKKLNNSKQYYSIDSTNLEKKDILNNQKNIIYRDLDDKYKNDIDIIIKEMKKDNKSYCLEKSDFIEENSVEEETGRFKFKEEILKDEDVKKLVLEIYEIKHPEDYYFIKKYTNFNREDINLLLNNNGDLLEKYPKYKKDKEMVLKAISTYPYIYVKLDKILQEDEDILNKLSKTKPWDSYEKEEIIKKLSKNKNIINNKERLLKFGNKYKGLYKYITKELKDDRDILDAYECIDNLKYYPKEYQEDIKYIKELYSNEKYAYLVGKKSLKSKLNKKVFDNEDFIKLICESKKENIVLASKKIKWNVEKVKEILNIKKDVKDYVDLYVYLYKKYQILDEDLLNNMKYYRALLVENSYINDIDEYSECKTVKELLIKIISINKNKKYYTLPYISERLMKDKKIIELLGIEKKKKINRKKGKKIFEREIKYKYMDEKKLKELQEKTREEWESVSDLPF